MKIIHLMTNDKFYVPLINFLEKEFNITEHIFWFWGGISEKKLAIPQKNHIYTAVNEKITLLKLIKLNIFLNKSEKIFLHGISNFKYLFLFITQPWLLKKVNWIILGEDLYYYQKPKLTFKSKVYEFMRAFCIKRFGGLITCLKGDYELAQQWYGATGKWYDCFVYLSNLYKEFDISMIEKDENKIYIQVGNSADPSNNHIEILDKLKQYKDESIEIICPISYGDPIHAKKVKEYGEKIFGEKFIPLTEFLTFDKYLEILGKIDIAIFNHKRQQAMGNTITLLGLGKKVYIRSDITTWKLFEELDIKVWDTAKEINLQKIEFKVAEKNKEKIKERFSEEKLKEEWEKIFKEEK